MSPPGGPLDLSGGVTPVVIGRSARATLVLEDPAVSARHCELRLEDGLWRVRDLGSPGGTLLNEQPLHEARALFEGDALRLGGVVLRFETDLPGDDPGLVAAIASDPDAPEPWQVYADQLEERGDPLGLRLARARAGARLDHQPWLGPLWEHLISGALEVEWSLGFARTATLRTVAGRLPLDWRAAVTALFSARVGRFLRELTVDLSRLEQLPPAREQAALAEAQRWLAAEPRTPSTLRAVRLGYRLAGAGAGTVVVLPALAARAPGLAGATVFCLAPAAVLELVSVADGVRVSGLTGGIRRLEGVVRLRRGSRTQLHLESPPGIPFLPEGNPCYLAQSEGRVRLITGRMRGEVRVNGRPDALHELLPGDLIELQGAARLRFGLAATSSLVW